MGYFYIADLRMSILFVFVFVWVCVFVLDICTICSSLVFQSGTNAYDNEPSTHTDTHANTRYGYICLYRFAELNLIEKMNSKQTRQRKGRRERAREKLRNKRVWMPSTLTRFGNIHFECHVEWHPIPFLLLPRVNSRCATAASVFHLIKKEKNKQNQRPQRLLAS